MHSNTSLWPDTKFSTKLHLIIKPLTNVPSAVNGGVYCNELPKDIGGEQFVCVGDPEYE